MIRRMLAVAALCVLSGCAQMQQVGDQVRTVVGPSPEAQIVTAVNTHTLAVTTTSALLSGGRITVAQASGFRGLLVSLRTTLDGARDTLVACRKTTGSNERSNPDPCRLGVADLLRLAADGIGNVKRTLDGK